MLVGVGNMARDNSGKTVENPDNNDRSINYGHAELEIPFGMRTGVPELPLDVVNRPRLFSVLANSVQSQVTTLTAPAGWGKTQLLASWVRSDLCIHTVCWLTIDRRDSDPNRFWPAVLSALSPVLPSAQHVLSDDPIVPLFEALTTLDRIVVVVLDDIHHLDQSPVESELSWLLLRLPSTVRVILSGMYLPDLPVSKLRVEGKLRTINTPELSFNAEEAGELLAATELELSYDVIEKITQRTEGWSAGLRLAALAMVDLGSIDEFVEEFTGDDADVADYLVSEVLARIPAGLHDFLLQTSICEVVSPDLAKALTGRIDSCEVLRLLARRNSFVMADAPRKGWFRYHGMLAELLKSRLKENDLEEARRLYRIASRWFAENGMYDSAFQYSCEAQDWSDARNLLMRCWLPLYLDGQLVTVQKLLRQLPSNSVEKDRELSLIETAVSLGLGTGGGGDTLETALSGSDPSSRQSRRISTAPESASKDSYERHPLSMPLSVDPDASPASLVVDMERGRLAGDLKAVAVATHGVLEMRSAADSNNAIAGRQLTALALQQLGITEYWVGRRADAEDHILEALAAARENKQEYIVLACLSQHVGILTAQNRLTDASAVADEAAALAHRRGWELTGAAAELWHARGWAAYMRGNLDAAEQNLAAAIAAVRRQDTATRATILLVRGFVLALRGRKREALADIEAASHIVERMPARYIFDDYLVSALARTRLAMGDVVGAQEILDAMQIDASSPALLALAYSELMVSEGRIDEANVLLDGVVCSPVGLHDEILQPMLLSAILKDQRSPNSVESYRLLLAAVDLAEEETYVQPFLQFAGSGIDRLLKVVRRQEPRHVKFVDMVRTKLSELAPNFNTLELNSVTDSLVDPLTKRELQVLHAIEEQASLPELADKLYVSVNTLKAHLRSLYRKMEVNGRREAVVKARSIGLL